MNLKEKNNELPGFKEGDVIEIKSFEIKLPKKSRTKEKMILYIDEVHLLLDKDNSITINFLYQTVKRICKYNVV